jgi:hypothetical protein
MFQGVHTNVVSSLSVCFREFILTSCPRGLYVFDPINVKVVLWTNALQGWYSILHNVSCELLPCEITSKLFCGLMLCKVGIPYYTMFLCELPPCEIMKLNSCNVRTPILVTHAFLAAISPPGNNTAVTQPCYRMTHGCTIHGQQFVH